MKAHVQKLLDSIIFLLTLNQSIIHFWLIAVVNIIDGNSFVNIVDCLKHFMKEQLDEEKSKSYKTFYHFEDLKVGTQLAHSLMT